MFDLFNKSDVLHNLSVLNFYFFFQSNCVTLSLNSPVCKLHIRSITACIAFWYSYFFCLYFVQMKQKTIEKKKGTNFELFVIDITQFWPFSELLGHTLVTLHLLPLCHKTAYPPFVVYFNQRTGAPHTVRWLK